MNKDYLVDVYIDLHKRMKISYWTKNWFSGYYITLTPNIRDQHNQYIFAAKGVVGHASDHTLLESLIETLLDEGLIVKQKTHDSYRCERMDVAIKQHPGLFAALL